jgi:hypothetical protein
VCLQNAADLGVMILTKQTYANGLAILGAKVRCSHQLQNGHQLLSSFAKPSGRVAHLLKEQLQASHGTCTTSNSSACFSLRPPEVTPLACCWH